MSDQWFHQSTHVSWDRKIHKVEASSPTWGWWPGIMNFGTFMDRTWMYKEHNSDKDRKYQVSLGKTSELLDMSSLKTNAKHDILDMTSVDLNDDVDKVRKDLEALTKEHHQQQKKYEKMFVILGMLILGAALLQLTIVYTMLVGKVSKDSDCSYFWRSFSSGIHFPRETRFITIQVRITQAVGSIYRPLTREPDHSIGQGLALSRDLGTIRHGGQQNHHLLESKNCVQIK